LCYCKNKMKISAIKINRFLIFFTFFLLFTPQCKKDKKDLIPYIYVNFYVNVNSTQYNGLSTIGGWAYVTGGVRGIILYHKSVDEFMAYDRDCPYQTSNTCALLTVDKSMVTATDSCCGSQFLLLDGSIVKGPATIMLKQYTTSYDENSSTLHVSN
jgi:nitrite reductase/ring-hydroxylating ferredoxin subunit